jgi:cysteine desulfurase/selenocysteine lyase
MMHYKHHFPLLQNQPQLIYLDSAATTQKPQVLIDSLSDFYSMHNANVHRGLYQLSEDATTLYEAARATLARFIGATPDELIFTAGTTDGMNKLALALAKPEKQSVLLSGEQHHSAILPWRQANYIYDYVRIAGDYQLDYADLERQLSAKHIDILVLTYVSNVTGAVLDFTQLAAIISRLDYRPLVVLDAAQALAHIPINVTSLGIDFLVGSAHKVYGPTGIGILWGKAELLDPLPPMHVGGGMIRKVGLESTQWTEGIERFEAGTPPIAEAVAWASVIQWLQQTDLEQVHSYEQALTAQSVELLCSVPGIELYIPPKQLAVISFNIAGLHPHDISQLLGDPQFGSFKLQIAVRAGHHCAQIMHQQILKVPATARVSLGMYNTINDFELLIAKLTEIIKFLPH